MKAAGDPATLTPTVRQAVRAHDPELPIPAFRTMDDVIGRSLATRRFQLLLVALFAGLAALLASVGVYGVMAYSVAQRSPEIGIRLALGARPGVLVRSVLREAMLLAVVGLLIAVPSTVLSGSFLSRYLWRHAGQPARARRHDRDHRGHGSRGRGWSCPPRQPRRPAGRAAM